MMENKPVIYVVAGPNGIGKSTSVYSVLPINIPIINADDIAKQFREELKDINVQEIANAEAIRVMNEYLFKKESFGFETNLADNDTWQFLTRVKLIGYQVVVHFFCSDNIDLCINRVLGRTKEGGHFVREDIIRGRYANAIKLLRYYKDSPDLLILTDNSTVPTDVCKIADGKIELENHPIPKWVIDIISESTKSVYEPDSIDEIREKYKKTKQ
ncbi:MAG: hypothetical protein U5M51_14685 [Emticicia sp.]|nr:hypothetical protein [Emticicia sp.]